MAKFKLKKRVIKSRKRSSKVSDFVELALKRSRLPNVTDNRKYRKNFPKDKAENKTEILNNNTTTIGIVGRTELEDVRVYYNEKSDLEKSIVNIGMTGQLMGSGNISSSEEVIKPADNFNACRIEGQENIDHGVDENHLGEEIISNNKQGFNSREKQSKSKNNISLSQRGTSLVDILASLLREENTVQTLSPSVITRTAGNVSTHGNSTSCSKTEQEAPPANSERIKSYFCSDTVFNLSNKVLSETEISVLEKGLGFVSTPNMINGVDLRRDLNDFIRKMRCKWYFRDKPSKDFSEIPAFRPKSTWKPPVGDPCVELFLSKMEHEQFSFLPGKPQSYNLTREEWQAIKNLKDGRSTIIKPADKGSCVVLWDHEDYLAEGYKQLNDESIYGDVKHSNDKTLSDPIEKSNNFFKRFNRKKNISDKELKYFSYSFKNASCLGNIDLLPKIFKRLYNVPRSPAI